MEMSNSNVGIEVYRHYVQLIEREYGEAESEAMLNRLFEFYVGCRKVRLLADRGIRLSESQLLDVHFGVKSLLQHIPLQYIIGETDFYGFRIKVDKRVLIPRPETEELVKWIVDDCEDEHREILDIGTGSGCIAVALSKLMNRSVVDAIDVSGDAIDVAVENARLNEVNVRFVKCDVLAEELNLRGGYDLIVSNPPYIGYSERVLMKPNVLNNEPELALFVPDDDVLLFYETICRHAANGLLKRGGAIYFEINELYGEMLNDIAKSMGFDCEIRRDINEKSRMARLNWK